MEDIKYVVAHANENEIISHLWNCNRSFCPTLSERVDINAYGRKIYQKAVTFEAWKNDELIGLVAAYFNDKASAFITSVSVTENNMQSGVASELLRRCIEYAKELHFREIRLEVYKDNEKAIRFYRKFNFISIEDQNNLLLMRLPVHL